MWHHLSPLASAIRTAQAQGHRVSVVCAWDDREVADSRSSMRNEPAKATRRNARELFAETQSTFLNRRFQQLQRQCAKLAELLNKAAVFNDLQPVQAEPSALLQGVRDLLAMQRSFWATSQYLQSCHQR